MRVPPCGTGSFYIGECYFLLAQKVTKDAPRGVSPMNATRSGRSKSPHPLDPHLRGTPSRKIGNLIRRAKTRPLVLLASGLRPFMCKIW